MAINVQQELTTGVNWDWREAAVPVIEVDYSTMPPGASTTRDFVLKHDQDNDVVITGFYLSPIEDLEDHDPFQEGWDDSTPVRDVEELLFWGDQYSDGLYIVQGGVATRFQAQQGSSIAHPIACTLGAVGNGKIAANEEINVSLRMGVPAELPEVKYLHFNVKILYRKVPTP